MARKLFSLILTLFNIHMVYCQTDMFMCSGSEVKIDQEWYLSSLQTFKRMDAVNNFVNDGISWNPVFYSDSIVSFPMEESGSYYIVLYNLASREELKRIKTYDFALTHTFNPERNKVVYVTLLDHTMHYVEELPNYRDIRIFGGNHIYAEDIIWGDENKLYVVCNKRGNIREQYHERDCSRKEVTICEVIDLENFQIGSSSDWASPTYRKYRDNAIGANNLKYAYLREEDYIFAFDYQSKIKKIIKKGIDRTGRIYISPHRNYLLYSSGEGVGSNLYCTKIIIEPVKRYIMDFDWLNTYKEVEYGEDCPKVFVDNFNSGVKYWGSVCTQIPKVNPINNKVIGYDCSNTPKGRFQVRRVGNGVIEVEVIEGVIEENEKLLFQINDLRAGWTPPCISSRADYFAKPLSSYTGYLYYPGELKLPAKTSNSNPVTNSQSNNVTNVDITKQNNSTNSGFSNGNVKKEQTLREMLKGSFKVTSVDGESFKRVHMIGEILTFTPNKIITNSNTLFTQQNMSNTFEISWTDDNNFVCTLVDIQYGGLVLRKGEKMTVKMTENEPGYFQLFYTKENGKTFHVNLKK